MKMQLSLILFGVLLLGSSATALAQGDGTLGYDRNIVKLNLTALPLKSFDVQYERAVARKMSVALGIRTIPSRGVPYSDLVVSSGEQIDQYKFGNFAITPEFRFYVGKNDGPRGFYFAPFVRYSVINLRVHGYRIETSGKTMDMDGSIKGISGGVMLGSQWRLGSRVYLDWWILGGGFGSSSGTLTGNAALTASEQQDLRDEFDDIGIGVAEGQVDVDANGVRVGFDGPWATLRGGLLLGINF